ncbi:hypothetical protein HK101_008016 [Irineochytrium annulatum]|nr:hypothetical protein HK101_008016 [Irineochytrium annulatum]
MADKDGIPPGFALDPTPSPVEDTPHSLPPVMPDPSRHRELESSLELDNQRTPPDFPLARNSGDGNGNVRISRDANGMQSGVGSRSLYHSVSHSTLASDLTSNAATARRLLPSSTPDATSLTTASVGWNAAAVDDDADIRPLAPNPNAILPHPPPIQTAPTDPNSPDAPTISPDAAATTTPSTARRGRRRAPCLPPKLFTHFLSLFHITWYATSLLVVPALLLARSSSLTRCADFARYYLVLVVVLALLDLPRTPLTRVVSARAREVRRLQRQISAPDLQGDVTDVLAPGEAEGRRREREERLREVRRRGKGLEVLMKILAPVWTIAWVLTPVVTGVGTYVVVRGPVGDGGTACGDADYWVYNLAKAVVIIFWSLMTLFLLIGFLHLRLVLIPGMQEERYNRRRRRGPVVDADGNSVASASSVDDEDRDAASPTSPTDDPESAAAELARRTRRRRRRNRRRLRRGEVGPYFGEDDDLGPDEWNDYETWIASMAPDDFWNPVDPDAMRPEGLGITDEEWAAIKARTFEKKAADAKKSSKKASANAKPKRSNKVSVADPPFVVVVHGGGGQTNQPLPPIPAAPREPPMAITAGGEVPMSTLLIDRGVDLVAVRADAPGAETTVVEADEGEEDEVEAEAEEASNSCRICLLDFEVDDKLRELPCGHLYHEECAWR